MSNRNIHVNPNFYSQSHPNIHINPSFVKKVDNFSERGIDVDINEESLNIGQNLVPNINTKASKSSTYNLRTNQSLYINKNKPLVSDTYKFVRNTDGVPLTIPYNQSTILSSTSDYSLNKGNPIHTVSQNSGTVSRYTFLNSKHYKSSRTPSTKSPLKNNSHKYLSPSAKSSFSVNHNLRFPEISSRNICENEGAEKNSLSHSIGVNTKMNSKNLNHRSDPFTICNNLLPQSANNNNDDSYGTSNDVKQINSKNFSYSFSNQNILRTDNDILCKQSNLKSNESKKNSELLQSCIYSPPTIFKSRLKLIRRDTIRKSAKYIREDLLAKKRKYAVKTKTKLVRRNSTNYKCQKSIAPKLSKLRRSLTLRKGSLLRAKERVVFNHVSKPRATLFSKQNKFFRNGSIISNFKIRKSQHSKSKYSSPPSGKYAWSLANKRGHVKKLSDKFININGNLYKSTATSLKKQDLSPKPRDFGPHVDGPIFYPTITTINLGSHTVLDIYRPFDSENSDITNIEENDSSTQSTLNARKIGSLLLERRSLLVLQEDLYTKYLHGIAEKPTDVIDDLIFNLDEISYSLGDILNRETRVSLTIRYFPKVLKFKLGKI
ncbi:Alpha-ketoglutarate-dependent dioxygenase alkB-like protein 6 [Armadillidium nasatum]|uniref:Alpha-ketoglutarate-dependent dioxygenase alkB-like protein 6 n=1 Tax=Armadillidium nasatum TaxID=96803 RepID=A0A5N5TNM0_9CRUS|nr:Alpha-ketoglutarate-dependent dioxygenase alkB-like protein 6 [Armadillidium nasatum]